MVRCAISVVALTTMAAAAIACCSSSSLAVTSRLRVLADTNEVTWSIGVCKAGSTCTGSFQFVNSADSIKPRLASLEVINSQTSEVLDVVKYNSKSVSWVWYVPTTFPAGQYRYRYTNPSGGITVTSPEFSTVAAFQLCTPEAYFPRTLTGSYVEAVRVYEPRATTEPTAPGKSLSLYFAYADESADNGDAVLSMTVDLIEATSRTALGKVVKNYEYNPTTRVGRIAIPSELKAGSYIIRLSYVLGNDPKASKASYSEVFGIGASLTCTKNGTDNPTERGGNSSGASGTSGGGKGSTSADSSPTNAADSTTAKPSNGSSGEGAKSGAHKDASVKSSLLLLLSSLIAMGLSVSIVT